MCRLILAFTVRTCMKTGFCMALPTYMKFLYSKCPKILNKICSENPQLWVYMVCHLTMYFKQLEKKKKKKKGKFRPTNVWTLVFEILGH